MRYSTQIKPISYVKSNASELLDRIEEEREPIIITRNGEARAVLIDIHSYEQSQETLALLKILAIGEKQIEQGDTVLLSEAIRQLRSSRKIASPVRTKNTRAVHHRKREL